MVLSSLSSLPEAAAAAAAAGRATTTTKLLLFFLCGSDTSSQTKFSLNTNLPILC